MAFNLKIGMLDYPHYFSCWAAISFAGYAQSRLWAVPYSRGGIKSAIPYRCCTWMIVFRFLLLLVRGLYLFRRLFPIHSYASWIWNAHWHIILSSFVICSPFDIVIGIVLWTAEVCFVEWLDQVSLQHLFKSEYHSLSGKEIDLLTSCVLKCICNVDSFGFGCRQSLLIKKGQNLFDEHIQQQP